MDSDKRILFSIANAALCYEYPDKIPQQVIPLEDAVRELNKAGLVYEYIKELRVSNIFNFSDYDLNQAISIIMKLKTSIESEVK
jgi:hypothetical protein